MPATSGPSSQPFSTRLAAAIRARRTPACVGLDPRREALPEALGAADTHDPATLARIFTTFCHGVIDVVAPLVPIVKPQLACFEALGPHGMTALADTIAHARARGLLVLADGKRGDIGSTAEAYADGWLAGPWACDALTVNPYLGLDSIAPFVKTAAARHAGIFVLVKTSNPGSKDFQDLDANGSPLHEHVAAGVEHMAADTLPPGGRYGLVGAVVGATWPRQLDTLRAAMPHAWILVPGFGKQGGRASDVQGAFDPEGLGAIVVSARDVIFAHARPEMNAGLAAGQWQAAVERACHDMIDRIAADTPAGRLRD
ncbi:MAG: orotidine-5'-phosphate decarboxylase [Planctomycetaceae bacterium]